MKESFLTVLGESEHLTVIEKSRFICYLKHIESEEDAKAFIDSIKKKHFDATHNCSAFIADSDGQMQRFSDDGEPQGTAGMPMLEALKNKGIYEVVAVVTRYFGGIKLGAGGLVRAYNGCVISAINNAKVVEKCFCKTVLVKADYDRYNLLTKLFVKDCKVLSTEWDNGVNLTIAIKVGAFDKYKLALNEMFFGKPDITVLDEGYVLL
ncbi:MAG: YigZ family protein [Clostridia bacterium]|nr:YigZ family protein [Clostridia bacterium]